MSTYPLKVTKNGKDFDEKVSVDLRKKTETYHLRDASTGKDAGDILHDFKRNLTMMRVPEAKSCFLSDLMSNVPRPADLLLLLKLMNDNTAVKISPQSVVKLKVADTLNDLSVLSKEMKELCANLKVYRVTEGDVDLRKVKQTNDAELEDDGTGLSSLTAKGARVKRGIWKKVCKVVCTTLCWVKCSGWACGLVCRPVCHKVCSWVFG